MTIPMAHLEASRAGAETPVAGRELDAVVAEKVMGWTRSILSNAPWQLVPPVEASGYWVANVPHYSTDIAAAWHVIDRMVDKGGAFGVWLAQTHESLALCQFQVGDIMHESEGVSFPHAICLAAIAATCAATPAETTPYDPSHREIL